MTQADGALTTLRHRVECQEQELRVALAELGTATRKTVDPRRWIQDKPFVCVLGALAFGLWLGRRAHPAH